MLLALMLVVFQAPAVAGAEDWSVLDGEGHTLLYEHLLSEAKIQFADRTQRTRRALRSAQDLRAHQERLRADFRSLLRLPPRELALRAETTRRVEADGYTIEAMYFESRDGHRVTANLYLPEGRGPFPAVLVACGHSPIAKAEPAYQRVCALLALNGFVVLIYDPIGQGERHQLELERHGTTEHELLNLAALLIGETVVAHELWDGIVAVDYLRSRPDVDSKRPIGLTGNSGGGTQASFLMAHDKRIGPAALSCCVMTRERLFETIGPQDGCQHLPGEGELGLEHADYILMRAPKPTAILAARQDFFEFAATEEAYAEARRAYEVLREHKAIELFVADDEHGFTRPRREAAVRWMRRWLMDDARPVEEPELELYTEEQLRVSDTGQVRTSYKDERTIPTLLLDRGRALAKERASVWSAATPEEQREKVSALLGLRAARNGVGAVNGEVIQGDGYRIEKLSLRGDVPLPALLLVPDGEDLRHPATLWLDDRGKQAGMLDGELERLAREGGIVLALDLRGFGETADEGSAQKFGDEEQRTAALARHIGRPLLGQRVEDVKRALDFLRAHTSVDRAPIEIMGIGRAGPVALHAAFLDREGARVRTRGSLSSWFKGHLAQPGTPGLAGLVVPGVLEHYDLSDLVRALGDRHLGDDLTPDPAQAR